MSKEAGQVEAYTTAKDMERFWNALMKGRLLSPSMVNEMLAPQVKEEWYGYGVWLKSFEDSYYLPFVQGSKIQALVLLALMTAINHVPSRL